MLQVLGERKPPDKDVGPKRLEWVSERAAPGVEIPTHLSCRPGRLVGACRAGCRERASARPGKRCAYLASKIDIVGQVLLQQAHTGLGSLAERPRRRAVQHPAYGRAWRQARTRALDPATAASGLARRPYDLRDAALSLWLNAGASPAQIAARAGHSVTVLLSTYVHCVDGHDDLPCGPGARRLPRAGECRG